MKLAAIVFILKIWHHYLYGEQFEGIFKPQKSEVYFHTAGPQHEAMRVDGVSGGLRFALHYYPDKENVVVNALSRKS